MAKHHDVKVSAPRDLGVSNRPVILQREDEDFIEAVLEELRTAPGRAGLAGDIVGKQADPATGAISPTLKLYQPIQRRFHLALIEAWCDVPGKPRIDPAKVDAAGMVLRRLRGNLDAPQYEGWMRSKSQLRGWLAVDRLGDAHADPQSATRLARRATGSTQIDHVLGKLWADSDQSVLEEQVIPMFVAPPDVCEATGRSLFYGVVQTTSSELASAPPDTESLFEGFDSESSDFITHLAQPLHGMAYEFPAPPGTDRSFDGSWLDALQVKAGSGNKEDQPEATFLLLLRQLAGEFDAFSTAPKSVKLLEELDKITLSYVLNQGETTPRTVKAGTFLKDAVGVLMDRDPSKPATSLEMPKSWPALDASSARQLRSALHEAMLARFASVKGRAGRFDEPDARYVLRSFVRLKAQGTCPPKTIWSDYSEPFVIAAWYEGGGGSPVQIDLPDVTNRDLLKSMKPNVSFVLPPKLQSLLSGDPKKMLKGEMSDGGWTVGWICSFSIPIITICAFIVLNIFLTLFDIFFKWMMFLKICIPYPKKK